MQKYLAPLTQGATWRAVLLPPGIALGAGIVASIVLSLILSSIDELDGLDSLTADIGLEADKIGYALPFVLIALSLFGSAAMRFDMQAEGFMSASAHGSIVIAGAPLVLTIIVLAALWWSTRWTELRAPSPNRGSTWIRIGISSVAFTLVLFLLQIVFAARFSFAESGGTARIDFSAVTARSFFLPLLIVAAISLWARIAGHFKGAEAVGASFFRRAVPPALTALVHLVVMVAIMSVVSLFVLPTELDFPAQTVPLAFVNLGVILTLLVHFGGMGVAVDAGFDSGRSGLSETLTLFSSNAPGTLWFGLLAVIVAVLAATVVATVTRRPHWTTGGQDPHHWQSAWQLPVAFAVLWGLLSVLAIPLRASISGSSSAAEAVGFAGSASAGLGPVPWSFLVFALWGGVIEVLSRTLGPRLALTVPAMTRVLAGRAIHPHWGGALGMSAPRLPLIHPDIASAQRGAAVPRYDQPAGSGPLAGTHQAPVSDQPPGSVQAPVSEQTPGLYQYPDSHQYPGSQQYPDSAQHPGPDQHPGTSQYPSSHQYPGSHQHPGTSRYPGSMPATGTPPWRAASAPYAAHSPADAAGTPPWQTASVSQTDAHPGSAPMPPVKPFDRKKATLVGAVGGGAVLILVAGLIVVTQVNGRMFGPEAAVDSYLSRLADGDAEGALEIADVDVPKEQRQLLTNDILGAAQALPTDITVEDATISDDHATVQATYDLGGSKSTAEFSLVKSGKSALFFDEWTLQSPDLSYLAVDTPGLGAVTVNGVEVATADEQLLLPAFPALYRVELAEDSELVSAEPVEARTFFAGAEDEYSEGEEPLSLDVMPTDAFRTEVDKQVKTLIDSCAKKTVAEPDGCPFESFYAANRNMKNIKWSISSYPTVTVSAGSSDYDGASKTGPNGGPAWTLSTETTGEAFITGTYDGYFDKNETYESTETFSVTGTVEIVDDKIVITLGDAYDY